VSSTQQRGEICQQSDIHHILTSLTLNRETIQWQLKFAEEKESKIKWIEVLIDDDATGGNYISSRIIEKELSNYEVIDSTPRTIGTGFNGISGQSKGTIRIYASFYDEIAKAKHEFIPIDVTITDCPYDLIIGKYTKIE
jgi:hypothetical protein